MKPTPASIAVPENREQSQDLTKKEYELFRAFIYEHSGINLGEQKMQLLRARLGKRLREGGFRSYREYFDHVQKDTTEQELALLLDSISTNTTHLFRERQHFDFLAETLQTWANDSRQKGHKTVRIWSAGCSCGDEPYTIAMTAADALRSANHVEYKILATDLSRRVLARAEQGMYEEDQLANVPGDFVRRFFVRERGTDRAHYRVHPDLRSRITFARFNLMTEKFPFRHGFDVIFCRNVMIYFDKPTQEVLVNKFAAQLKPGGYLLIGHSESLNNIRQPLAYCQPTIYRKPPGG